MDILTVGELKSRFSEILKKVQNGQEIIIGYGRKKEKIAVLVPYAQYNPPSERKLGILKDTAQCIVHEDFSLSEDEMLRS